MRSYEICKILNPSGAICNILGISHYEHSTSRQMCQNVSTFTWFSKWVISKLRTIKPVKWFKLDIIWTGRSWHRFPLRGHDWTFTWDINSKGYIQPKQVKQSLGHFPPKKLIMKNFKQQSWKNIVMNTYVHTALIQPFSLY